MFTLQPWRWSASELSWCTTPINILPEGVPDFYPFSDKRNVPFRVWMHVRVGANMFWQRANIWTLSHCHACWEAGFPKREGKFGAIHLPWIFHRSKTQRKSGRLAFWSGCQSCGWLWKLPSRRMMGGLAHWRRLFKTCPSTLQLHIL